MGPHFGSRKERSRLGGLTQGDIRTTGGPEVYYEEHEAKKLFWATVDGLSSGMLVVLDY